MTLPFTAQPGIPMKRFAVRILPLLLLMIAAPMSAQTFQEETARDLEQVRDKFIGLAETMPDAAMSWRPGEGVRSVSEVYMHIALANVGLATAFWGAERPAGAMASWSEQTMDRDQIVEALRVGFDHVIALARSTSDADLEGDATIFGRAANVRAGFMLIRGHAHEHLGQSIAYARANGHVPPWSR